MGQPGNQSLEPITAPDLDLPGAAVIVSAWLAPQGATVVAGDRVVELSAGDVTIDVSAPVSGVLVERRVDEDEPAPPGEVLGWIASDASDPC
jgi:pyruvate/2-oxoglutarate dehydrogenase complex dihydrolipoamide acyltransferase (E2) component